MELLGVSTATGPIYKGKSEEGRTRGNDPAFSLLLALLLGEQTQLSPWPPAGGGEPGQEREGELLAEPLLAHHPPLPVENQELAVDQETELPFPPASEGGTGELEPRVFNLTGGEVQLDQLVAEKGRKLSLPREGGEELPASPASGDGLPPEAKTGIAGLDTEGLRAGETARGKDKPLAGEPSGARGEGGAIKGEDLKVRPPAPETTSPPFFTATAAAEFQPETVQPAPGKTLPLDVAQPDFMDRLVARVELARERGETQLSIQLKPEALGKMQVEFVYRKGSLSTRLVVENQEVRELLAAHLPALQETLSQQGLQLDSVAVDVLVDQQGGGDTGSQGNPWLYQQGAPFTPGNRGSSDEEWTGSGPILSREGFDYLV
ncbi:MAG: flagellar hook-length control protein FliK [bacterium]|nr:hypothetical protein [Bacillota bacterium]